MQGLFGEYNHKLDAKGRLTLPSSFRKALPENLVVTESPDASCLFVFDAEGFNNWVKSLFAHEGDYDAANVKHAQVRKVLNSRARPVEVDTAHRIGLSPALREAAHLGKDVVIVGDYDHFEIWDAKRWRKFCGGVDVQSILQK